MIPSLCPGFAFFSIPGTQMEAFFMPHTLTENVAPPSLAGGFLQVPSITRQRPNPYDMRETARGHTSNSISTEPSSWAMWSIAANAKTERTAQEQQQHLASFYPSRKLKGQGRSSRVKTHNDCQSSIIPIAMLMLHSRRLFSTLDPVCSLKHPHMGS